ncbi:protein-methionine-sulfoxide reductase heme-binding subunit MsrQ [Thalassotalea litorea]|uniref:Protein-methionine-sulfoxide reductase heme-binding subunit MsrQ n=1 Tax=Thalassotalea litorea TaxID=2020715 RepID=A0A5R9ING6_9GAMM|nr:protein-methionine-sulfoxide reductase heme-binding subunit MsrQ [Thalassotalea litorea]TLU64776.1 protein-methionine-sulfoxide reductase heme-binding subunit MsrQ [Thalassotalea litorea]
MSSYRPSSRTIIILKCFVHTIALVWALYYYFLAINDQLGSDPVKAIIHFTGMSALNTLLLTLMISPLAKLYRLPWLLRFRRLLGLYAFFFACLHLVNFIFFELQFDFSLFIEEVIERPYITLGMAAFVILFALAITSFKRLQRKMGRQWQALHNMVYLAAILIVIHFYWSVKSDIIEPGAYVLALLILLALRRAKLLSAYYRRSN